MHFLIQNLSVKFQTLQDRFEPRIVKCVKRIEVVSDSPFKNEGILRHDFHIAPQFTNPKL